MTLVGWALGVTVAVASPLTLEEVLAAVDPRVPDLAAAALKAEEAEGKLLGARGSFDPKLKVGQQSELQGKYPRSATEVKLAAAALPGFDLEVGWTRGVGSWPAYDGGYETTAPGEAMALLQLPLLKDLGFDAERAKLRLAEAGVDVAQASLAEKRVLVTGKAAAAYWKWVATGEKLALADSLLKLAEVRQQGLERSVQEGLLPPVEALDNRRVVLVRRAEVFAADAEQVRAAQDLSLYLRDGAGTPQVPGRDRLPPTTSLADRPGDQISEAEALAVEQRPDLRVLAALITAAEVDLRLARNELLPELGVQGKLSQELAAGYALEVDAGLGLTVPLLFRKGRGGVSAAEAAMGQLQEERRGRRDAALADLQALTAEAALAWDRWAVAREAQAAATEVARLELRAFELGSSDIFRLTKREEEVFYTGKTEIEARLEARLAEVARRVALGLEPAPSSAAER